MFSTKLPPSLNTQQTGPDCMIYLCRTCFQVLSDPDKRKIYDRSGEEGLSKSDMHGGDPFSRFVLSGMYVFMMLWEEAITPILPPHTTPTVHHSKFSDMAKS